MSVRSEYLVIRTEHIRGENGRRSTKELGSFATVREADKAAKTHAKELARKARKAYLVAKGYPYGKPRGIHIGYDGIELRPGFTEEVIFNVVPRRVEIPEANKTAYGEMISIPCGKPGGLKGARFIFLGSLEYLTHEAAQAAVCAYGGEVITYSGPPAPLPSRPFSHLDFLVAGAGVSDITRNLSFGIRQLDKRKFFKVLRHGLPTDPVALDSFLTDGLYNCDSEESEESSDDDDQYEFYDDSPVSDEHDNDGNEGEHERPTKRRRT